MEIDLPVGLQGGGTITWLQLQSIFTRPQLADVNAYWERTQGTNIVDASALDIPTMREYFLRRRLPA